MPVMPEPPAEEPIITLDELEKRQILRALEHTGGNRTEAARILAISIRTLRNKIALYREQGTPITGDD